MDLNVVNRTVKDVKPECWDYYSKRWACGLLSSCRKAIDYMLALLND